VPPHTGAVFSTVARPRKKEVASLVSEGDWSLTITGGGSCPVDAHYAVIKSNRPFPEILCPVNEVSLSLHIPDIPPFGGFLSFPMTYSHFKKRQRVTRIFKSQLPQSYTRSSIPKPSIPESLNPKNTQATYVLCRCLPTASQSGLPYLTTLCCPLISLPSVTPPLPPSRSQSSPKAGVKYSSQST
jgi:hypothetical protein